MYITDRQSPKIVVAFAVALESLDIKRILFGIVDYSGERCVIRPQQISSGIGGERQRTFGVGKRERERT